MEGLQYMPVEAAAKRAPTSHVQHFKKAFLDTQMQNFKLAYDIAALREEMATKETRWEEEKNQILTALKSEGDTQKDLKDMNKEEDLLKQQNFKLAYDIAALKEEMATKETRWEEEKNEIFTTLKSERAAWKQTQEDLKDKTKEEGLLKQQNLELLSEIAALKDISGQNLKSASDQNNLLVKSLQEASDMRMSQVVLEKDDLIVQMQEAKIALQLHDKQSEARLDEKELGLLLSEARLQQKEHELIQSNYSLQEKELELIYSEYCLQEKKMQLIQSEVEWKTKLADLDAHMRSQLDSKNQSIKDLQRTTRDIEQQWKNQQSLMEEQIRILTNSNTELQAQVLSLEERLPEKMTSEELKVHKKEIKRLIKERKEEERQEREREVTRSWFGVLLEDPSLRVESG